MEILFFLPKLVFPIRIVLPSINLNSEMPFNNEAWKPKIMPTANLNLSVGSKDVSPDKGENHYQGGHADVDAQQQQH